MTPTLSILTEVCGDVSVTACDGFHCHFDWLWNHLGDTPVVAPATVLLSEEGRHDLNVGGTTPKAGLPDWVERTEKEASMSTCFMVADTM